MFNIFSKDYQNEKEDRRLFSYLVVAALALFTGIAASHFQYTPDDAYIYFQYAKKIALGRGFSFNGVTPSYGATGPLWALMIAGGIKAGLTPYAFAKSIDLASAFLAIVTMYFLSDKIIRNTLYALLATLLFTFDAWLLRWSGSGMETSIAAFMAIGGIYLFLCERYNSSAAALGCLTLMRPEGGLLFAILYLKFLFESVKGKRPLLQRVVPGLIYAVMVGAWLIFAYRQFGRVLPNSFYGKSGSFPNFNGLAKSSIVIVEVFGATQLPLTAAAILVLFLGKDWAIWRGKLFLVAWVFSLPAFYVLGSVQIVSRYLLIVAPFFIIVGVVAVQQLCQSLKFDPKRVNIAVIALLLLTLAQNQMMYWSRIKPHLDSFALGTNECLKPMGRWLRDYSDSQAIVFAPDVGVVGYYSDRTIYDTGLITPEGKRAFQGLDYDEGMLQRKEEALHPDFVIDRSPSPERLASSSLYPIMSNKFSGLSMTNVAIQYYTLYRVVKN